MSQSVVALGSFAVWHCNREIQHLKDTSVLSVNGLDCGLSAAETLAR